MKKHALIVIAGPTASGKTAVSVELALRLGAEIISADSMQVWRGLNIGTAKITEEEKRGVPHHMIDTADFRAEYSVGEWLEGAKAAYERISGEGKPVLLVGGTGMYIKAFLYGFSLHDTPKSLETREKYLRLAETKGNRFLLDMLDEKTGGCHKIHENDTKRLVRALEVLELKAANAGSSSEPSFLGEQRVPLYEHLLFALSPPREELYARIEHRVDGMIENGLIDEVRGLMKEGASPDMQSMQAIGYKEAAEFIAGKIDFQTMRGQIKKNTRNYAKRQLTFFRSFVGADGEPSAIWVDSYKKDAFSGIMSVIE